MRKAKSNILRKLMAILNLEVKEYSLPVSDTSIDTYSRRKFIASTTKGSIGVRLASSFPSFIVSCKKGQWTTISGLEREPIGNFYFAGEHCSEDFQGFMDGGAATGRIVAEKLLQLKMKRY